MLNRVDRYLIGRIMLPLVGTLSVAALLLLLERMLRLFDFVVNQGGPVEVVFRMLGSLVPHYLGLALPIGMFLGILLAFRKLSLSSELEAITISGVSLLRMTRPVLILTVILMGINFLLVAFIQPESRYAYRSLVFDLRSGALGASVKVGEFVDIGDDFVLRIEESHDNGADLRGIFLERTSTTGRQLTITAKRGGFFSTGDRQNIYLRLFDGKLIDLTENEQRPRVLTFDIQDIAIDLPTSEGFRRRGGEYLELRLSELRERLLDGDASPREFNVMRANLHWRIAHTLSFLALPFLAIALGIANKRTAKSTGIVVGLALLIVYNELLEVTEVLVADGSVSPYLSIWALFVGFLILSLYFFRLKAFCVGREPLLWLDLAWAAMNRPLRRIGERVEKALS